jgi:hypothetical protein
LATWRLEAGGFLDAVEEVSRRDAETQRRREGNPLGIQRTSSSQLESQHDMQVSTLQRLVKALGASWDSLLICRVGRFGFGNIDTFAPGDPRAEPADDPGLDIWWGFLSRGLAPPGYMPSPLRGSGAMLEAIRKMETRWGNKHKVS